MFDEILLALSFVLVVGAGLWCGIRLRNIARELSRIAHELARLSGEDQDDNSPFSTPTIVEIGKGRKKR